MAGKVGVDRRGQASLQNPDFEPEGTLDDTAGDGLLPVYRLTEGIRARTIRRAIRAAIDTLGPYPDYLAGPVRDDRVPIGLADRDHPLPGRPGGARCRARAAGIRRAAGAPGRHGLPAPDTGAGPRLDRAGGGRPVAAEAVASIERTIGAQIGARTGAAEPPVVSLTGDQRRPWTSIRTDLASGRPMMRLVQGDVGSGKTAVAALAMAFVADAGGQSALLAPTDLLARQHAATLGALLEPLGHEVVLLTGSVSAGERREALALGAVADGTHAHGSQQGPGVRRYPGPGRGAHRLRRPAPRGRR